MIKIDTIRREKGSVEKFDDDSGSEVAWEDSFENEHVGDYVNF